MRNQAGVGSVGVDPIEHDGTSGIRGVGVPVNENGNVSPDVSARVKQSMDAVAYEYKDGKLYKEYDYNTINEISSWNLYEYNSKGLLVKKAYYNAESGREVYGDIYEYDEYDNKIKDSAFTHIIDYTYHDEIEITYWTSWEYEKY